MSGDGGGGGFNWPDWLPEPTWRDSAETLLDREGGFWRRASDGNFYLASAGVEEDSGATVPLRVIETCWGVVAVDLPEVGEDA